MIVDPGLFLKLWNSKIVGVLESWTGRLGKTKVRLDVEGSAHPSISHKRILPRYVGIHFVLAPQLGELVVLLLLVEFPDSVVFELKLLDLFVFILEEELELEIAVSDDFEFFVEASELLLEGLLRG